MKFNILLCTAGAIALTHFQSQAAYSTDFSPDQLSADEVITLVRVRPEVEVEQSEIYESAPEELLVSEEALDVTEDELQAEFQATEIRVAAAGTDFFDFFKPKQTTETEATKGKNGQKKAGSKSKVVGCHTNSGGASYYWQGKRTATGERFNPDGMTAAHRHLPFGHRLRVTNMSNGKSVIVTVNDRGPFVGGRIIDLSRGSFAQIASLKQGVARVKIESVSCS